MNKTISNKELTDEEYAKHIKELIKQMFKQFIFAVIITIITIPSMPYIIFGSDENLKILVGDNDSKINAIKILKGKK